MSLRLASSPATRTYYKRLKRLLNAEFKVSNSLGEPEVLARTKQQLDEYFHAKRMHFNIPLLLAGTDFQKLVWKHLLNIPFGQTLSYAHLSDAMGHKAAIRAVATANGANALSILVPCHRVIGSDGSLTGYAGGLTAKAALLQLEREVLASPTV